jgi:hypothetical protein
MGRPPQVATLNDSNFAFGSFAASAARRSQIASSFPVSNDGIAVAAETN